MGAANTPSSSFPSTDSSLSRGALVCASEGVALFIGILLSSLERLMIAYDNFISDGDGYDGRQGKLVLNRI